jgi:hypothetical protein
MTRIQLTWSTIRHYLNTETDVYDADGTTWRRTNGTQSSTLYRWTGDPRDNGGMESWRLRGDTVVYLDPPPLAEPPDGTRIEFEHHTDVYAAWRDDASSAQAGYAVGDGGEVWCLFGSTVPRSWAIMWLEFGDSLRTAVRLIPHADDAGNYAKWPTAVWAAEKAAVAR